MDEENTALGTDLQVSYTCKIQGTMLLLLLCCDPA